MYRVFNGYGLPEADPEGMFKTKEDAISYISNSIWEPTITYADEYSEPRQLKVRWFQGSLYHRDIMLDQRYCFNFYYQAIKFKEDFHIKIRELWRSLR